MSCKIVEVPYEEYMNPDFKEPSGYWIKNAMGNKVWFVTSDRVKAQEECDNLYGGKYKVNASKIQKQDKPLTCRGVATRRGQKK
jgi:hypothetical protein